MPFYPPVDENQVKAYRPATISERFPSLSPRTPDEQALLDSIAEVESSGGKNEAHPVIQSPNSMHQGQAAVGKYGMMPNTLDLIRKRVDRDGDHSPNTAMLAGMDEAGLQEAIKNNPDLEEEFATRLLRSMKPEATPEQKNFMWQFGNNANLDRMDKRIAPERASKFGDALRKRMQNRSPATE